jgi:hypothetical protein
MNPRSTACRAAIIKGEKRSWKVHGGLEALLAADRAESLGPARVRAHGLLDQHRRAIRQVGQDGCDRTRGHGNVVDDLRPMRAHRGADRGVDVGDAVVAGEAFGPAKVEVGDAEDAEARLGIGG